MTPRRLLEIWAMALTCAAWGSGCPDPKAARAPEPVEAPNPSPPRSPSEIPTSTQTPGASEARPVTRPMGLRPAPVPKSVLSAEIGPDGRVRMKHEAAEVHRTPSGTFQVAPPAEETR